MKRLCGAVISGLMLVPAAAYGLQNQPTTQSASDARAADREAIEAILENYKGAIERLDASGTEKLFATDSRFSRLEAFRATFRNNLTITQVQSWIISDPSNSPTTRSKNRTAACRERVGQYG